MQLFLEVDRLLVNIVAIEEVSVFVQLGAFGVRIEILVSAQFVASMILVIEVTKALAISNEEHFNRSSKQGQITFNRFAYDPAELVVTLCAVHVLATSILVNWQVRKATQPNTPIQAQSAREGYDNSLNLIRINRSIHFT